MRRLFIMTGLAALSMLAVSMFAAVAPAQAASRTNFFCWYKTNYNSMNCDSSSKGVEAPTPAAEPEPEPEPECPDPEGEGEGDGGGGKEASRSGSD